MNLFGTILVYAGFLALFVGGVSVLRPLTFLGIWSWFQGVMLVAGGILLFFGWAEFAGEGAESRNSRRASG